MRKFIYPFAMMAGLIIASSCTENEGARMRELRTRSISTAASASDNTGNPDAAPDANCPSPDTRMAYEDNNEAGIALNWQPTDAFKGFYTTPHVQEVVGQETSALFTYSEASAAGDNARARFTGNVAEDVDANTSFNLFYPAARSTGNTWSEAPSLPDGASAERQQLHRPPFHIRLHACHRCHRNRDLSRSLRASARHHALRPHAGRLRPES